MDDIPASPIGKLGNYKGELRDALVFPKTKSGLAGAKILQEQVNGLVRELEEVQKH